jgi:hypothetical protein
MRTGSATLVKGFLILWPPEGMTGEYTDKKKENFTHIQGIQNGEVVKSYMRKSFLIYEEMRKYLTIYEKAVSHI